MGWEQMHMECLPWSAPLCLVWYICRVVMRKAALSCMVQRQGSVLCVAPARLCLVTHLRCPMLCSCDSEGIAAQQSSCMKVWSA